MRWQTEKTSIVTTEVTLREKLEQDLIAIRITSLQLGIEIDLYEADPRDRSSRDPSWVRFATIHDSQDPNDITLQKAFENWPSDNFVVDVDDKLINTVCQFERATW